MVATHPDRHSPDPTLPVAERQLAMLGELAQITMELARAHAASAMAAAHAVEVILADEHWQPETGRARALAGSKDAAEAFRKVSRSLRLTLALEMTTAETLRDLRSGVCTNSKLAIATVPQDAGAAPADQDDLSVRQGRAGSDSGEAATDCDTPEHDSERLHEFDRADRLPRGTFREIVEPLCADVGVAPDWERWRLQPALKHRPFVPPPRGRGECSPYVGPPDDGRSLETAGAPLPESVRPPQTPP